MKRKTIFILLVLVMCMALVPAAAYAQVWSGNTYGFHIAETEITTDNYADVFGDGTVTYDPDTKTLTLNNYHYSGPGYLFSGIYCGMIIGQTSTIELIGDNSITLDVPESGKQSVGLKYDGSDSIYFKGSGSLSIKAGDTTNANNYGITAYYGDLVFANDFSGSLTAVGGDLLTYGTTYGIYCSDIYIYSGTVTGIGGNHSGSYDSESAITSSGIYGGAHRVYGGTLTGIGGDISNTNGRGGYSYGIDGSNSSYSEIYIFDGTVIARGGNVYSSADNDGGAYSFGLQKYDASHPYSGGTTFTPGLIVYGGTLIAQGGNVSKASATDEVNWTRTQTYGLTGGTVIVDGGTVIAKAGLNNGSFKIGHHDDYTYNFLRSGFNAKLNLGASKIAGAVGYSSIDGNGFGQFTAVDLDQNYNLHGVVGGESKYTFTVRGRESSYNIPATGIVIVPADWTEVTDLSSITTDSYLVRYSGDAVNVPADLDLGSNDLVVADLYEGSDHPADRSGLSFAGGSITGNGGKLVAVGPTQVYYDETYSKGIYSAGDLTVAGDVDVVAFGGTANRSTGAEISGTLDVSGLTDTGSFISNGHNDGLAAAAVNTGSHCSKDLGVHFFAASRLSEDPVYTVTIGLGEHMSLAEGSGALSQSESGKLADIVVRADEGYYFPQDYLDQISKKVSKSLELTRAVKGQSASGLFVTEITISGIPSDNINIELPDTTEYLFPLWIGGVRVTGSNMGDITAAINKAAGYEVAAGSARMTLKLGSYYSGYETPRIYELDLSLTDFNYTGPGYEFETGKYAAFYLSTDYTYPYWGTFSGLVIDINGSNSITQHVSSSEPNTDECYGMYLFQSEGSVGITGSGSLVSTADIADSKALVAGLFRRRQLDIQNTADVKFTAPSGNASASYGMVSDGSSPLNVASAAKIEISGDSAAVYSKSGDSTISYTAPSYLAVSANIDGSSASAYTGAVPAAVSSLTAYKNIQLAKADLFVAGVPIGAANGGDVAAAVNAAYPDSITGSITYDAENSKLTLNGASVNNLSIGTDDNNFFGIVSYLNTPLNIELTGENTVTGKDRSDDSYAIYSSNPINFTGSGKLVATAGKVSSSDYSYGIYATITVDGPEIEAYGGQSRYYTAGISGNVTLKSGSVKAVGGRSTDYYSYGITGSVVQDGGKLTAIGGQAYESSYGVYNGVTLNDGEAYVCGGESTYYYSYGSYYGVEVNGGSFTADSSASYENSYGLGSGITVNGGTAVINAGDSTKYSSYGSNGTVNVNDGSLIINTGTAAYSCGVYATVNVNGGDLTVNAVNGTDTNCGIRGSLNVKGGKVTVNCGNAASACYGIYNSSLNITGGELKISAGDAPSSYAVYGSSYIKGGNVELICSGTGETAQVFSSKPSVSERGDVLIVSPNADASDPLVYDAEDYEQYKQYKYFKSGEAYLLWVAGTRVKPANMADILGDQKVSYDPNTNTLTLNNATVASDLTRGIMYEDPNSTAGTFTILVKGENSISFKGDDNYHNIAGIHCTYAPVNIVLEEGSVLNVSCTGEAANSYLIGVFVDSGKLTISGTGTLNAYGPDGTESSAVYSYGILNNGYMDITDGATVNAVGGKGGYNGNYGRSYGVSAYGLTVGEGCTLNAAAGEVQNTSYIYSIGINCSVTANGSITASGNLSVNGTVTAGENNEIFAGYDSFEVSRKTSPYNQGTSYYYNHDNYLSVVEKKPYLLGDVNEDGTISADDLTQLSRHVAQIQPLTSSSALSAADVNEDGWIDANDLTMLSRYVAKIINKLGAE